MIKQNQIDYLKNGKNLLAFSAGVDSTALFFLLLNSKIDFDIAIVNYNKREQSKDEIDYAQYLATRHKKKIFIKNVVLEDGNFEKNARDIRYEFFEQIIATHNYQNLLTAHQLNDKFEWFLMQFSRGAGVVELLGFKERTKRENYELFRPLIDHTKEELLDYLEKNSLKYFVDESNFEAKYSRNIFREKFSNEFIKSYQKGVIKTFNYLEVDSQELLNIEILFKQDDFYLLKQGRSDNENMRIIDKVVKKLGMLLSLAQKKEILKTKDCVVGAKIAICFFENKIFIAPYIKQTMPKKFKENCRISKIPNKIRAYLYSKNISYKDDLMIN